MGLTGVGSPQQDDVGLLDLKVRGGTATRSEHCRQTDDTWRVSSSITRIDVVRAEGHAGELLCRIVHLVGRLRTGEDGESLGTEFVFHLGESLGGPCEGLVPCGFPEHAVLAHHRGGQSGQGITELLGFAERLVSHEAEQYRIVERLGTASGPFLAPG